MNLDKVQFVYIQSRVPPGEIFLLRGKVESAKELENGICSFVVIMLTDDGIYGGQSCGY